MNVKPAPVRDHLPATSGPASRADAAQPASRRRRRIVKRFGIGAGIAALLLGGGGLAAVNAYGPHFGFYLLPPSPQRYVDIALELLDTGYYAHGDDWTTERARVKAATASTSDYAVIHAELKRAAKVAGGKHSFLLTPAETKDAESSSAKEFTSATVASQGGVTTVTLPEVGFVSNELTQKYADAAASGIKAAAPSTCGWIVDLRGNTGGTMYPMLSGVSALLPNGPAMTFRDFSGKGYPVTINADGVEMVAGLANPKVDAGPKVTGKPIAVLLDGETASSGEAVATAFRGLLGVESFGAPTAGYTSANSPVRLYDGATLVLTGSVYVDRTGASLDELPITPDHVVAPADAPAAAQAWLASKGCR